MSYYLLLLPGLAVIGIGLLLRRRAPALGQTGLILGCVVCLAAFLWQVRQSFFPESAKVPSRAHAVVGYYLANQVQALVAGRSGRIVVILPATSAADAGEEYAGPFSAPLLRGHPELTVEVVRLETQRKGTGPAGVDSAAFKNAVAKMPNSLAYVSYAGVPPNLETLFPPSESSLAFFVFDPKAGTDWVAPLKKGIIRSVIVPRTDVDQKAMSGIAGLPGEVFDQLYWLATPANADSVGTRLAAKR